METNEYFTNKQWKEIKRQKVQSWTRVMGFIRNVNNYNIGKKSEFYSRRRFNMPDLEKNPILMARANAEFNTKYQ